MKIVMDLDEVLNVLRMIMSCDITQKEVKVDTILGLTEPELREHSHYPEKYYKIKQMILPTYTMGIDYALLNQIRASIRECEIYAIEAFKNGDRYERVDIIRVFNRLSSTIHIMMCKYLAGYYK